MKRERLSQPEKNALTPRRFLSPSRSSRVPLLTVAGHLSARAFGEQLSICRSDYYRSRGLALSMVRRGESRSGDLCEPAYSPRKEKKEMYLPVYLGH